MIYILLNAVGVFFLVATFGLLVARFARQQERLESGLAPELPPEDPYALLWWQDLQDLGLEFHLANGEIWRGRISWHRYPDGADESHAVPMKHWNKLDNYRRRIEWKEPAIMSLHAHTLVDWTALDRAYQVKLLNGSLWQFNTKSEGLGKDNEMAWHLISSPPDLRHEALVKVYKDLNVHLEHIRRQQERGRLIQNHPLNRQLDEALARASIPCGVCRLAPVSIPGGICASCRAASGSDTLSSDPVLGRRL